MGERPGPWVVPVGWAVADLRSRPRGIIREGAIIIEAESGGKGPRTAWAQGLALDLEGRVLVGHGWKKKAVTGSGPAQAKGQAPWIITAHQRGPEALG